MPNVMGLFVQNGRRLEDITRLRQSFLLSLDKLDQIIEQEISQLALYTRALQNTINRPNHRAHHSRRDLILCDEQAIEYEEAIFRRTEIRTLIRDLQKYMEDKTEHHRLGLFGKMVDARHKNGLYQFLGQELSKPAADKWIFYLNSHISRRLTHKNMRPLSMFEMTPEYQSPYIKSDQKRTRKIEDKTAHRQLQNKDHNKNQSKTKDEMPQQENDAASFRILYILGMLRDDLDNFHNIPQRNINDIMK